jgi:protein ImuA
LHACLIHFTISLLQSVLMLPAKADIIAQLRKDILPLQGIRNVLNGSPVNVGLGMMNRAFPNASFPLGAIHEFCCKEIEDAAASCGFIAGIAGALMQKGGAAIWVSTSRMVFPPALKYFGIEPDKMIFIDLQKQKDVLWVVEEALKCEGLAAVIGEIPELNFTASRRLQLAVEQSRVTGFILRHRQRNPGITASVARWKITPLSSTIEDDMPGVGFPRWQVELLKIRNGTPAQWQIEWSAGRFRAASKLTSIPLQQRRKTG